MEYYFSYIFFERTTGIKRKYENISPALPIMKMMQNLNEGQRNELCFPVAGKNSNM